MIGQLGWLHVLRRTLRGADLLTAALGLLALLLSLAGGLLGEDVRAPLTAAVSAALLHGALTDPRRWTLPGAVLLTGALLTPLSADLRLSLLLGALGAAVLSPVGLRGRAALTRQITRTETAALRLLSDVQALHAQQEQVIRDLRDLSRKREPLNTRMQALRADNEAHQARMHALSARTDLSPAQLLSATLALQADFDHLNATHHPDMLFTALNLNLARAAALQRTWQDRDAVLTERTAALERLIGRAP